MNECRVAYEVTKRIKGRDYRYRVESTRDPATGARSVTWKYLGRVDAASHDVVAPRRRARESVRERVARASLKLLESRHPDHLTVAVIARETGISPATFYRHVGTRGNALSMALGKHVDSLLAEFSTLAGPIGTASEERRRFRSWIESLLQRAAARPRLLHALPIVEAELGFAAEIASRQRRGRALLAEYLERLLAAGVIHIGAPRRLAGGITVAVEGLFGLAARGFRQMDDELVAETAELLDGAIFGSASSSAAVAGRSG